MLAKFDLPLGITAVITTEVLVAVLITIRTVHILGEMRTICIFSFIQTAVICSSPALGAHVPGVHAGLLEATEACTTAARRSGFRALEMTPN